MQLSIVRNVLEFNKLCQYVLSDHEIFKKTYWPTCAAISTASRSFSSGISTFLTTTRKFLQDIFLLLLFLFYDDMLSTFSEGHFSCQTTRSIFDVFCFPNADRNEIRMCAHVHVPMTALFKSWDSGIVRSTSSFAVWIERLETQLLRHKDIKNIYWGNQPIDTCRKGSLDLILITEHNFLRTIIMIGSAITMKRPRQLQSPHCIATPALKLITNFHHPSTIVCHDCVQVEELASVDNIFLQAEMDPQLTFPTCIVGDYTQIIAGVGLDGKRFVKQDSWASVQFEVTPTKFHRSLSALFTWESLYFIYKSSINVYFQYKDSPFCVPLYLQRPRRVWGRSAIEIFGQKTTEQNLICENRNKTDKTKSEIKHKNFLNGKDLHKFENRLKLSSKVQLYTAWAFGLHFDPLRMSCMEWPKENNSL